MSERENLTPYDLYKNNLFFRTFLGSTIWGLIRFPVFLSLFYALVYWICSIDQALDLSHISIATLDGEPVHPKGFSEDIANYCLIVTMLLAVYTTRNLFIHLVGLREHLPVLLRESGKKSVESEVQETALMSRLDSALDLISLKTPKGKRIYYSILGALAVSMLYFQIYHPLFNPIDKRTWSLWPQEHLLSFAVAIPWTALWVIGIVGNCLWYISSTAITIFPLIYQFGKARMVRVIPIAPDGQGGLSSIGQVAYSLMFVVASGVPFLIGMYFTVDRDASLQIGALIYFLTLVAIFFAPLMSVHTLMKEAKENELERLSELFRTAYSQLPEASEIENLLGQEERTEDHQQNVHYLGQINNLYERADTMPVWPFNPGMLAKFFSVIVFPLIVFLADILTSTFMEEIVSRLFGD